MRYQQIQHGRHAHRPGREEDVQRASAHCAALSSATERLRREQVPLLIEWGRSLAGLLGSGGRLLAAGNGGSAAQAQQLTAGLVSRYADDRPAYSAIALHADTSSLTAIGDDYGYGDVFARQIAAHGRPGDVLVALSTTGRSRNLLSAAEAARGLGMRVWALTGAAPNPLADGADELFAVPTDNPGVVQEVHLLAVHLLCEQFETAIAARHERTVEGLGGPPDPADSAEQAERTERAERADPWPAPLPGQAGQPGRGPVFDPGPEEEAWPDAAGWPGADRPGGEPGGPAGTNGHPVGRPGGWTGEWL